ncbi:dihydrofolate reductase family protein [Nocardia brasiliensis]
MLKIRQDRKAVYGPTRPADDPYAARINAMPEYVASRTLAPQDATWNATVLQGNIVDSVRALEAQDGLDILEFGTGSLSRTLLEAELVDEYHFWIFPAIAGTGERLFDGYPDRTHLRLLGTTTFKSGIVVHRLAPR